ncbi:hypothetical protein N866_00505 [Actinotalea ferrariae CF5-4]|uniref:Uncharacterized protein n=1 Tax=Actinotalea ferrariae CF5-4 TaxID=948458 RepID=A0A021W1S4_9CELL|nr:hypothetical protein N866_00505 [Actinotalea ferrariae CF5-4]
MPAVTPAWLRRRRTSTPPVSVPSSQTHLSSARSGSTAPRRSPCTSSGRPSRRSSRRQHTRPDSSRCTASGQPRRCSTCSKRRGHVGRSCTGGLVRLPRPSARWSLVACSP